MILTYAKDFLVIFLFSATTILAQPNKVTWQTAADRYIHEFSEEGDFWTSEEELQDQLIAEYKRNKDPRIGHLVNVWLGPANPEGKLYQPITKPHGEALALIDYYVSGKGSLDFDSSANLIQSALLTPDIATNSESTFASNNTHKDLIEDIRLKKLTLAITSPSSSNFRFLKSVELYILSDGLPEVKIAGKENIDNTQGSPLELQVEDINLKEYIIKDTYTLRLNTVTDELITQDHEIEVFSQFRIDAKVLGL